MTYEEAQLALETINKGSWFCPLIKDKCNTNCFCYAEPFIRNLILGLYGNDPEFFIIMEQKDKDMKEDYEDTWDVGGNNCINAMLIGS
jgi:hypothetical protein